MAWGKFTTMQIIFFFAFFAVEIIVNIFCIDQFTIKFVWSDCVLRLGIAVVIATLGALALPFWKFETKQYYVSKYWNELIVGKEE